LPVSLQWKTESDLNVSKGKVVCSKNVIYLMAYYAITKNIYHESQRARQNAYLIVLSEM
jgi:hypothetical protein